MSTAQLLLTMLVALMVFGPNKLPMLAEHLGRLISRLDKYKQQANALWQAQLNQQQLLENESKALEADVTYKKNRTTS